MIFSLCPFPGRDDGVRAASLAGPGTPRATPTTGRNTPVAWGPAQRHAPRHSAALAALRPVARLKLPTFGRPAATAAFAFPTCRPGACVSFAKSPPPQLSTLKHRILSARTPSPRPGKGHNETPTPPLNPNAGPPRTHHHTHNISCQYHASQTSICTQQAPQLTGNSEPLLFVTNPLQYR